MLYNADLYVGIKISEEEFSKIKINIEEKQNRIGRILDFLVSEDSPEDFGKNLIPPNHTEYDNEYCYSPNKADIIEAINIVKLEILGILNSDIYYFISDTKDGHAIYSHFSGFVIGKRTVCNDFNNISPKSLAQFIIEAEESLDYIKKILEENKIAYKIIAFIDGNKFEMVEE